METTEIVKNLISVCKENGINHFLFKNNDIRINLSFKEPYNIFTQNEITQILDKNQEVTPKRNSSELVEVKSNFVGTLKLTDQNGNPIVFTGSLVKKDQVIGSIVVLGIEQMIISPVDGIIESIEVTDGKIVDYGKVIFKIKPS